MRFRKIVTEKTHPVGRPGVGEGCVEPLVEGLDGVEDLGEGEVEQGPQFGEVVIKRGTCQDETVTRILVLREGLGEFRLRVLHTMTLIFNDCKRHTEQTIEKNVPMIMCSHLCLHRIGRSLMMYSYVVNKT